MKKDKKKKILIFSTAYLPHVGGAEVAVAKITERLSDEYDFDLLTVRLSKKDPKVEKIGNVYVYRLGCCAGKIDKLLFPFRSVKLARQLHKKNNYSLIWSIMASFSGFGALHFKNLYPKIPFLLTLQEGDNLSEVEGKVDIPFIKNKFKDIFKKADSIQAISNYLADWAKRLGSQANIEVVPNAVDIKKFQNLDFRLQKEIKDKFNLPRDAKVVVTTSRLVKKNGIGHLVSAIALLPGHVHLLVVGSGPLCQELQTLAKRLSSLDRVHFVGSVPHHEIPNYLHIADVFCRPSLTEGLGNSFLEAMAAGIPVVATPVGGIVDFLKEGKTGWFCNVNDARSIAEKIMYIIDEKNEKEVESVIQKSKQMVEKEYTWQDVSSKMLDVFNRMTR